jgi:hypothetical protein
MGCCAASVNLGRLVFFHEHVHGFFRLRTRMTFTITGEKKGRMCGQLAGLRLDGLTGLFKTDGAIAKCRSGYTI